MLTSADILAFVEAVYPPCPLTVYRLCAKGKSG
jgi:hypothetical protein